ncbi:MAG: hypothetical protein Q8O38_16870 [Sulfurimicrobium sp.]|nr:hypothetical protein [Sulfurimicrobium sp.]
MTPFETTIQVVPSGAIRPILGGAIGVIRSVGFAPENHSFSANSTASDDTLASRDDDEAGNSFTRCHDDAPTEHWDSELGEFRKPQAKPSTVRNAAVTELERGLARLGQHHANG